MRLILALSLPLAGDGSPQTPAGKGGVESPQADESREPERQLTPRVYWPSPALSSRARMYVKISAPRKE